MYEYTCSLEARISLVCSMALLCILNRPYVVLTALRYWCLSFFVGRHHKAKAGQRPKSHLRAKGEGPTAEDG